MARATLKRMGKTDHFDRRSATYDQGSVHPRVASLLVSGVNLEPGFRVLDIATGTGFVALEVARKVGPSGHVTGIDISDGMLRVAQRKVDAAGVENVRFLRADAETLTFPEESFDCLLCASGLVFMTDIPQALKHWFGLLKAGGQIAFDTPAKPFGLLEMLADAAGAKGVHLNFATVADTQEKCRDLLSGAGFEVLDGRAEQVDSSRVELGEALGLWESHLGHPALEALCAAPAEVRGAVRADYEARLEAVAVAGYVPNDVVLNLSFGRKP